MPNSYFTGQGTVLRRGQTIPAPALHTSEASWVQLSYIKKIRLPNRKKKFVETSVLDVLGALVASGGIEPQDCELELVFDPTEAQQIGVHNDAIVSSSLARRWWEVVCPDVGNFTIRFQGEVVDWTWGDLTPDEKLTATVLIKINGAEVVIP